MTEDLRNVPGIGVAGNFAGHLEQAGEAENFRGVKTAESTAPKAVFPFYIPGNKTFLGTFCVSPDTIRYPAEECCLQTEPEVGIIYDVAWDGDQVSALKARSFGASNDCSIRKKGDMKISVKKNWGEASKGLAAHLFPMDDGFSEGSSIDRFRITCLLKRGGTVTQYGVDAALSDYSYFHEKLDAWLVDRLNGQKDEGPAEDIHGMLLEAGKPGRLFVSIGATRYTPFGADTMLKRGDLSITAVYDGEKLSLNQILKYAEAEDFSDPGVSWLPQRVI